MNLGGTVGAFDFDVLQGDLGQVLATQAALVLPPDEAATDHGHQQQQADAAQDIVRQAHRLFDTAQRVHVAAFGVGAGVTVEGLHQGSLVQVHQLGIGADITTGEGMPRQLVEGAGFHVVQRTDSEVELAGHLGL
ncbi:hypothetical protein D3C79_652680 [compost metagenome]